MAASAAASRPEPVKENRRVKCFLFLFFWIGVTLLFTAYYQRSSSTFFEEDLVYNRLLGVPRLTANFSKKHDCDIFFNSEPLTPDIAKYFKKKPPLACSKTDSPNLLYVEEGGKYLKLNKTKAKLLKKAVDSCEFASLTRTSGSDFHVTTSPWSKRFRDNITIPEETEHILGKCYHNKNLVGNGYISIVRKKPSVETSCQQKYKEHVEKNNPKETLSILLVGLDGMSKHNFARQMPKTKEFLLTKMGALEMFKVNKLGLNTFPNVMPLLTGYSETEVRKNFSWSEKVFFDKINHLFLWEKAKSLGYRTSVIFDKTKITSFHFLKKGWNQPTWHYYNRPVVVKSEFDKVVRHNHQYCVGDVSEIALFYDYWLQLTRTFNNSRTTPYFGYSFFAHITHDIINQASMADAHYLEFFQKLSAQKSLNNTLVVFFSDHGSRYGDFRSTYRGMLEDSNPFMLFMFPPWFESKYPKVMSNFRRNQHHVITNYDVHVTFQDLLNFKGDDLLQTEQSKTDKGISLFREIPSERTCEEANIPLKVCICRNLTEMQVQGELAYGISSQFLKHVIGKTDKFRDKCAVLTLNSTISVFSVNRASSTDDYYQATIQTSPGGAVYEAAVKVKKKSKKSISVVGVVGRLNMYRGQADCVSAALVRPFCFCKDLL